MVEITNITTPVKIYGPNYITRRCSFTGNVQNESALYDNSAESTASFYTAAITAPVTWHVAFKDKYGAITAHEIDSVIFENCTATQVEISYLNTSGQTVSLGGFALQTNTILTLPLFYAQEITFAFTGGTNYFSIGEIRCLKFMFDLKATSQLSLTANTSGGEYTTRDGHFYSWTDYHCPGLELSIKNGNYAQFKQLRACVRENVPITLIPMKELDFWCLEGKLERDLEADVDRISGLLDYTLKVVSL